MPLTDGVTTNIWLLATATGEWRQVTDFGDQARVHRPAGVVVGRRPLDPCRGRSRASRTS